MLSPSNFVQLSDDDASVETIIKFLFYLISETDKAGRKLPISKNFKVRA